MKTIYYPGDAVPTGSFAATIGFFDGVHNGHRYVIEQLRAAADARGLLTMVVTFDRQPRQVVQPDWQPQLLTTLEEKQLLLSQTGIDVLVVLHFDRAMAALTARQFMDEVLGSHLNVKTLLTGYDNRFGHDRTETFADYCRYGRDLGIEVLAGQALTSNGTAINETNSDDTSISSSYIRRLLTDGKVGKAFSCLGRPYSVGGQVVHGEQMGRQMGFPTANIQTDDEHKLLPASGVYAVVAECSDGTRHGAMANIGTRPTFHGQRQTLEVHIFDNIGDIYGEWLRIYFIDRLREERPFASPEALARQLRIDKEEAERRLGAWETRQATGNEKES